MNSKVYKVCWSCIPWMGHPFWPLLLFWVTKKAWTRRYFSESYLWYSCNKTLSSKCVFKQNKIWHSRTWPQWNRFRIMVPRGRVWCYYGPVPLWPGPKKAKLIFCSKTNSNLSFLKTIVTRISNINYWNLEKYPCVLNRWSVELKVW